ncbi:MAG: hypothetical protein HC803_05470 [Saprospiraceae bacterium]|nr:hypothetical protein [Saprospiraceae bacterium]
MSYLRKMFENVPDDSQYVGNIFGWKISIIGAIVLVLVIAIIAYGHFTGKVDITTGQPIHTIIDSTNVK